MTRNRRRPARQAARQRRVSVERTAGPDRRRLLAGGAVIGGGALLAAAMLAGFGGLTPSGPGRTPAPATPTGPVALAPGTYQSRLFQPQLTFTVPAGWWTPADIGDYLSLRPIDAEEIGIYLFRDPSAASQDATCPQQPAVGVGRLSSELLSWIRARPGLTTSNPRLATIGGLRGVELDLAIADGWTESCPFASGLPTVPLFVGKDAGYRWVIAGSEQLRIALLDLPGGGTVVVDVDAFEGSRMAELVARAAPIVQSFSFGPGAGPSPSASPSASP